ncbi:chymotrypsin-2-like [Lutzomyia longipalpis]|uniref:chymotrypsin-2-like n=1 Tax=Lutzomyia longipalpis TaxID=7200 RepID=UPI0024836108|nr:chymotrypsin-2-like [Lutzomyia longipalpis]
MWPFLVILAFLASATHGANLNRDILDGDYRIIGGQPFNGTNFVGYSISLRIVKFNYHVCGGALIASHWALTAAHCGSATMLGPLQIVVGVLKLSDLGERYDVAKFIIHPLFNNATLLNDVGLIRTSTEVKFSQKVQPIQMAPADFFIGPGIWLQLIGWGLTKYPDGKAPDHVNYIQLHSITNAACQVRYKGTPVPKIHISQLCTFNKAGQGSCKGDSGGPLVSQGILMGIISWGVPCGKGYPDVHTRIAYHRAWIDQTMAESDKEEHEESLDFVIGPNEERVDEVFGERYDGLSFL